MPEDLPVLVKLIKYFSYAWRLAATAFSYILFGLGAFLLGVLGAVLITPLPVAIRKKRAIFRYLVCSGCRFFVFVMRALGLLSVEITGKMQTAVRGHIIIANHPTLIDAIFLIAEFKDPCCIVKGALETNPFTSLAIYLAGYIPNSSLDFLELATARLEEGENILIFPEGTRSRTEDEMTLNFKRGAANVAVVSDSPIIPVLLTCEPLTLAKGEKWYAIPVTPPHFSIAIGAPIRIADSIDVNRPRTVQYRYLTRFLADFYQEWLLRVKNTA